MPLCGFVGGGRDDVKKKKETHAQRQQTGKQCSSEGLNTTFGFVCHAENNKNELGHRCVSIKSLAGNHPGGDGAGGGLCDPERWSRLRRHQDTFDAEGRKKLTRRRTVRSTAMIRSQVVSQERGEGGTQDSDLHARGTACFNAFDKAVEKLDGLKDIVEVFKDVLFAGKGELSSARLRLRVPS